MKTHTVRLTSADGHEFGCWESTAAHPRGHVVILQEIFGVTDQLKEFASVLIKESLSVTIPQLFDRHQPDTVVPFSDADAGRAIMNSLDLNETLSDVEASINHASSSPLPLFIIGFCWGGGVAFRAAQRFATSGTIVFYGTKLGDYLEDELLGPALLHFGKTDPLTPPELVEKIGKKFPSAEIHTYGCGHAFANHHRQTYDEESSNLAIQRTIDFINRHLGYQGTST